MPHKPENPKVRYGTKWFHIQLELSVCPTICTPPLEIVPNKHLRFAGDEVEVPLEVILVRVIRFVSKLQAGHEETWRDFLGHVIHIPEAQGYFFLFSCMSPSACQWA